MYTRPAITTKLISYNTVPESGVTHLPKKIRTMLETIKKLKQEQKQLSDQIRKIQAAIQSLQEICSHTQPDSKTAFRLTGSDSHHNYYQCSLCQKEKSE